MFQTIRPSRALLTATAVLLLASVATAGPKEGKRKAVVEKEPDGTVSLINIASSTGYETEEQAHARVGSSPQAQAAVHAEHYELTIDRELQGGILGGVIEAGGSRVRFTLTGEGDLEGFNHTIDLPASFEVHSAPRKGASVETFDTNMYRIQGEGKSEVFEYFRLVGGTANGYPSPGQMTLTSVGDNQVMVESFFNIGFRIEFKGAKEGPFAGLEDKIEGAVIMRAHAAEESSR